MGNVSEFSRRALLGAPLAAFTVYALLVEASASAAVTDRRLRAKRRIDRQEQLAQSLTLGEISALNWHDEVNRIASEVDVEELMSEVRHGRVETVGKPFMRDPVKRSVAFVDSSGAPRKLIYAAALFSFDPTNVITPHAHKHMASAHMVVEGKVRIRTFDRVADEENAIVIRPTGDHIATVGSAAAMTTAKDNVHWFVAASPNATTFDVIVDSLDAGQESYVIQPLDPLGGRMRADGAIVAPVLSFDESMRRYSPLV